MELGPDRGTGNSFVHATFNLAPDLSLAWRYNTQQSSLDQIRSDQRSNCHARQQLRALAICNCTSAAAGRRRPNISRRYSRPSSIGQVIGSPARCRSVMRVQRTGGQIIMRKPMGLIYGYLRRRLSRGCQRRAGAVHCAAKVSLSAGSG
jgi:hypothetical protein